MEFKKTLADYTEPEFLKFVSKIWTADVSKQEHDSLIAHFDTIAGHPSGADLIFHTNYEDAGIANTPIAVVASIKHWHKQKGRATFKREQPPAPTPSRIKLSRKEQAVQRSAVALAKAQKLDADTRLAAHTVDLALDHYEGRLALMRQTPISINKETAKEQLAQLQVASDALELARYQAHTAEFKLGFFKLSVQFANERAANELASSFTDPAIQAQVREQATATFQRYEAHLRVAEQRHRDIHERSKPVFAQAETQQVHLQALVQQVQGKFPPHFQSLWTEAAVQPCFLSNAALDSFAVGFSALQKIVRSAVAEFSWLITTSHEEHLGQCVKILEFDFSDLSSDQRYGLTVPLSELVPLEGRHWQSLAQARANVYLPFRMGSEVVATKPGRMFVGLTEVESVSVVYLTPTNGSTLNPQVRVRAAHAESQPGVFSFVTDDVVPTKITWAPPTGLDSFSLEAEVVKPAARVGGFLGTPSLPELEPLTSIKNVLFDDYIVVFPESAGLDPLYVMFRDPREHPGVVTGHGEPVTGLWLHEDLPDEGALVPSSVADQLRGSVFKRFDMFVQTFWKTVAADALLSVQFDALNLERMKAGKAPFAGPSEPYGIFHFQAIAQGGETYDLDNLRIDY